MPSLISEKQLDLYSIKELPESHAWGSSLDDHPPCDSPNVESIPVIDLNDEKFVMDKIGHACKTWGAFQIRNHNISQRLLNDMESAAKKLFSLPMQQKLKAARSPDGIGGYGVARISSFFSKLMWSEGFTIFGSPVEHASQLWPHDYNEFWYFNLQNPSNFNSHARNFTKIKYSKIYS